MKKQKLMKLTNELKQGKSECFDEFYDLTKVSVYYTIKKIVKDSNILEDIMQDTYVKFINSLQKIDANYNPFSYLLMIARNTALDECKKNNKVECLDFTEESESVALNLEKAITPLSCEMETKFDAPLLNYCKDKLSDEEYKILELTVIYGYKRVEVAEMLNIPKSTLNWQYNNILKKIKNFYKEVYNEKI
ncbi:MAG: RNA polymerase sigma factor [Christensenellales bacterium]